MDEVRPDIYERVWPAGNADRSWTALRRRVARGKTAAAESGAGNHDCAEQPATRQGGSYGLRGLRGKGRGRMSLGDGCFEDAPRYPAEESRRDIIERQRDEIAAESERKGER